MSLREATGSVLKMRDKGIGMPAAVVLWSPWADITDSGDTAITLKSFDPLHVYDRQLKPSADAYADPKHQKHPYVSPVYGDYTKGFPPTLIQVRGHAARLPGPPGNGGRPRDQGGDEEDERLPETASG